MLVILPIGSEVARSFLDRYHPMGTGGALKGACYVLGGFEDGQLAFVALLTYPRSRWSRLQIKLELSRLGIAPYAKHSASTFLRKMARYLRSNSFRGLVITYAMPDTSGLVYVRAGWLPFGYSSGARRSRRGPRGRPTPDTIGSGRRLKRFILAIGVPWPRGCPVGCPS
jgi:hypothetical protein